MTEQARTAVFDSMIQYGREALRASMLMNGGAAVALLTFIGAVWSRNCGRDEIDPLAYALAAFSLGVLLTAFAYAAAYFVQYYQNESVNAKDNTMGMTYFYKLKFSRRVAVSLIMFSFLLFFLGVLAAFLVFTGRFPSSL